MIAGMLSSTFVALRTQGIDTDRLRKACIAHFLEADPFDIEARDRFWKEFVRSRRAYREATDENLERVLART